VKKRIIIAIAALLLLCLTLAFAQMLVVPKYTDNREGAMIEEYYDEVGDHDVIFVGDCEVYESIVPAILWEEYGIRSFVRGSPQQLTWQSYYLLEETLRYETPKAVVFNVLAMKYAEPQNEAFNRMTLDGMRWSASKIGAIRASMTEEEQFLDYVFPLLRYHSRITALTGDDFRYLTGNIPKVTHSGYLMQTDIAPQTDFSAGSPQLQYEFGEMAWEYLNRMRILCEEKGVELILMKAPTNFWMYWWHDQWEAQIAKYAEKHDVAYYNFIPLGDEIGLDWNTDTYDGGAHLNVYGAEKLTRYFGEILQRDHAITDHRTEDDAVQIWAQRSHDYYEEKQRFEEISKEKGKMT